MSTQICKPEIIIMQHKKVSKKKSTNKHLMKYPHHFSVQINLQTLYSLEGNMIANAKYTYIHTYI